MSSTSLIARDGRSYPLEEPRWCADDRSPLMVPPQPGITPKEIQTGVRSQWRYASALALRLRPVTLGEGATPLVALELEGLELRAKLEWFNPTASFKDRGTSVMISLLASQRVGSIVEDSSGNAGASVAAYAAAAGIEAKILVPESTSPAKTRQCRAHGAEVEIVRGPRAQAADEAIRQSSQRFYASHNWHPFFLEGTKLLAYEVWEDLGFRSPDALLMPVGSGSLVLGCAIGFGELLRAGCIERVPRLLAVQPRNCSPLADAFAAGATRVAGGQCDLTIAEGTAIAKPVRDAEVLEAVRASGGTIISVEESAIAPAARSLAARGLYVEPTSALVAAALTALRGRGAIAPGEDIVVVLTGSGLRQPPP